MPTNIAMSMILPTAPPTIAAVGTAFPLPGCCPVIEVPVAGTGDIVVEAWFGTWEAVEEDAETEVKTEDGSKSVAVDDSAAFGGVKVVVALIVLIFVVVDGFALESDQCQLGCLEGLHVGPDLLSSGVLSSSCGHPTPGLQASTRQHPTKPVLHL